ncbi:MAG: hypothetical protein CSA18_03235 [Deltaproteobacteria bacterium]|nr:MAG: hypothetical protein CSA18_03235 [Deltaproteobacteria bacterium]
MYYTGIYSENGNYLIFVSFMHRKTAKRVYEPCFFKKIISPSIEELESCIKEIYLNPDFMILKKKFSQSGRPARKVITRPYFIINNVNLVSQLLDKLRISYSVINFNKNNKLAFSDIDYSDFFNSLNSVFSEKRFDCVKFKSLQKVEELLEISVSENCFDEIDDFLKAFGLICLYNEKYNKKIIRY